MCQDPKKGDVPVCILVTLAPKIEIKGKITCLQEDIYGFAYMNMEISTAGSDGARQCAL